MPTYKNIKIKKKGGGTRIQRVQVLPSGKYKFVKNLKKSKKKTNKASSTTKSSGKRMGKRKFTIPLGIVAPLLWKLQWPITKIINGDFQGASKDLLWHFAAVDSQGKFNPGALKTWIPVIIGVAAHKLIGQRLGVNRMLANAGVPLIRI